jgi:hypothetical protein
LLTKDNAEIDLIISRPGLPTALIEIKSTERVLEDDVRSLNRLVGDFQNSRAFCLSRDADRKTIGQVLCLPWQDAVRELLEARL